MSIIKTLDSFSNFQEFDPTSSNFPACKHFWPCTESVLDAASGLTDVIGNVVTGPVTAGSSDGTKLSLVTQPIAGNDIASGTLQPSGTKVAIMFAVGDLEGTVLNIGLPSAQGGTGGLQMLGVTSVHQINDGTTNATTASATYGNAVEGHALVLIPGTSLTGYRIQADTTYGTNGTADTTSVPSDLATINQTTAFGNATAAADLDSIYGLAVFHFDSVPGDLEAALQWMYYQWSNGNKYIYPGWRNRT